MITSRMAASFSRGGRKAWRVLWADGRAVQYFREKSDADRFFNDYKRLGHESFPPEFTEVQKGATIKLGYEGPHPNAEKTQE